MAFYKTAYEGNPKQAVADYVGDDYKQHNLAVANDKQGFIEYCELVPSNPDFPIIDSRHAHFEICDVAIEHKKKLR
ncbi:hypothetical protein [Psychrobacter sp. FDAARGOS_221]|uniref:hypothetical protein n=1 Tax=Psychrobacter sp. FDAARGOS_221 TaxID=1975705 RepID=UPI001D0D5457|nr:hypothetical protein [Psychrobacter sp. FDAARGOS_221]